MFLFSFKFAFQKTLKNVCEAILNKGIKFEKSPIHDEKYFPRGVIRK